MRRLERLCAITALFLGGLAAASPNDFQISKLGNPAQGGVGYTPTANANFRGFAREMGAALTAAVLEPPNSLGEDGFAVNGELSVVSLSPNSTTFLLPTQDTFSGPLLIPSVHVRKGLPFSLEIGTRVGYLDKSEMVVGTFEAKWAFVEGVPYLPTIAARGYLTRLFNIKDFALTTGGVDLSLGKRFAVGGMVTLTPYGGYALGFTGASSGAVDFDRSRDPIAAQSAPPTQNYSTYSAVSAGSNTSSRFYAGGRFIGGVVQIGAELSLTSVGSIPDGTGQSRSLPSVLAINTTFGFDF